MKKISIIGIGNVGISAAKAIYRTCSSEIILYDIHKDWAQGIAMDIEHSAHLLNSSATIRGTSEIKDIGNSDIIVISAGSPRKSGMSRMDLYEKNKDIIKQIGGNIQKLAPNSITIIVSNPVDHLTHYMKQVFPSLNIFGFGCSLDTVRYRSFIGEELKINPITIQGLIIGTHNSDMIPFIEGTSIGGVPITELLSESEIENIHKKTINAGTDIVQKLKTTGSSYTAGEIIGKQVSAIVHNTSQIFSVDVFLQGEMGFNNITLSVPAVINKVGIEKILPIPQNTKSFEKLKELSGRISDSYQI